MRWYWTILRIILPCECNPPTNTAFSSQMGSDADHWVFCCKLTQAVIKNSLITPRCSYDYSVVLSGRQRTANAWPIPNNWTRATCVQFLLIWFILMRFYYWRQIHVRYFPLWTVSKVICKLNLNIPLQSQLLRGITRSMCGYLVAREQQVIFSINIIQQFCVSKISKTPLSLSLNLRGTST